MRYLLSVNRLLDTSIADKVVDLAITESKKEGSRVVGIDFSGDPYANDFKDYVSCLSKAREAGLKVTVHGSENKDRAEETK